MVPRSQQEPLITLNTGHAASITHSTACRPLPRHLYDDKITYSRPTARKMSKTENFGLHHCKVKRGFLWRGQPFRSAAPHSLFRKGTFLVPCSRKNMDATIYTSIAKTAGKKIRGRLATRILFPLSTRCVSFVKKIPLW